MMIAASSLTVLLVVAAAHPASSADGKVIALVSDALVQAATPGDRISVTKVKLRKHQYCQIQSARVAQSIDGSGRVAVRIEGVTALDAQRTCAGIAWATVVVKRRVYVVTQPIARDGVMAEAVKQEERIVKRGARPIARMHAGAVAVRRLLPGTIVATSMVRAHGAKVGTNVPVHIVRGGLRIVLPGKAMRCGQNKACARLKNGTVVRGVPHGNAIVVTEGVAP